MSNNSKYHHGQLRTALIKNAIDTIAEGGVEAVSLRSLARKIGVSHAAPSRHFASRSDLLAAIARDGVEELIASTLAQATKDSQTKVERLRAMVRGYVGWAKANPVHHLILRNQDVTRHADDELLNRLREFSDIMANAIAEAQTEGWRSEVPLRRLLHQLVAFTAGLALVTTDPLYDVALRGHLEDDEVDDVVDLFFGQTK